MKTYIKYESTDYVVNKTKRSVACIMIVSICGDIHKVVGLSKCSPDDTFDETKGKRIAESRAKAQVYSIAANTYKESASCFLELLKKHNELEEYCKLLHAKEREHINNLLNS